MHPSVRSMDPHGKCPICGMDLVPVKKTGAAETNESKTTAEPSEFVVPVNRQQQIGVTYAVAEMRPLQSTLRAVGMVTYDKQRHWDYVSRVDGYVEKLEVASPGDPVKMGQPLLTLYSPDLLTTEQEFLDLVRTHDQPLIAAARDRLRLWNISSNQIAQLEQSGKASETLTLYSPAQGVVQNLPVDQGRHISVGDHLVDVADLSEVWVWAQFYQEDLPRLKKGMTVTVTTEALGNEKLTGKIAVIDPFLDDATRTARVRIDLDNPGLKLRPSMYVNVLLESAPIQELAVPVSAVLETGERNLVFLDKGNGRLEPRFIELNGKYGDYYGVKSGLADGDRIVDSANFLVDAESKVQGVLKSW